MKILYVTTISGTMVFFWSLFDELISTGFTIELACNCSGKIEQYSYEKGLKVHDIPFSRTPLCNDNFEAYKRIKKVLKEGDFDIVHCHTPNAAVITRLACRGLRKKGLKVFYTAHGFHFFKGASLKNWLVYYPIEWICSFWTDLLITINSEDYGRASKYFHAKRIEYVPGVGIDLERFKRIGIDRLVKRREIGVPEDCTLLLSVGELNENKNHETVIRAIAGMDVFYIIAGSGERAEHLRTVAEEVGMQNRVKLLGYRTDVAELYKASDVFVFPSFREGLGMAALEAMACGLPLITSNVHGINDYSVEGLTGYKVSPHSIEQLREAVEKLSRNKELCIKMGRSNMDRVKVYEQSKVITFMKNIYKEFLFE